MKIDKIAQKDCIKKVKEIAEKNGYKKIQDSVYKIIGEHIVFADFIIVNSSRLLYQVCIKKMTFDNIFWKIMRMEENLKRSNSLRVIGAFSAPSFFIANDGIELSTDIEAVAKLAMDVVNEEITNFINSKDLYDCIFSNSQKADCDILKCLAYIDKGMIDKAKEIAIQEINLGNRGRFVNEGKGFHELLLLCDFV